MSTVVMKADDETVEARSQLEAVEKVLQVSCYDFLVTLLPNMKLRLSRKPLHVELFGCQKTTDYLVKLQVLLEIYGMNRVGMKQILSAFLISGMTSGGTED